MKVTFYTKRDCPLCDEALNVLEGVQQRAPFELDVVDIMQDRAAFERYAELIPVTRIGEEEFFHRVTSEQILEALTTNRHP